MSSSDSLRETVVVVFGEHVQSAATVAPAAWIEQACGEASWTVGALVPNHYPSVLRVRAPEPIRDALSGDDWWAAYRDLFEIVASIGAQHTSSPDRAWFAVWEGHGFGRTHVVRQAPTHDEHEGRKTTMPPLSTPEPGVDPHNRALIFSDPGGPEGLGVVNALQQVPRFELPHRTYYLLTGPVTAATQLREPGSPSRWRNPGLFWPDDRRWFVATDVDFWSLYIGGDHDFITEIARKVPTPTKIVTLLHQLETEV